MADEEEMAMYGAGGGQMEDFEAGGFTPMESQVEIDLGPPINAGNKIDYSGMDPINFKKTATLVNYFIINTAQFLNSFSQVAETKLHEVDEKLDEIEQIMAVYEAKLESVPEEYFAGVPLFQPIQQQEVIVRTENPLQAASQPVVVQNKPKTVQAVKEGEPAKSEADKQKGYVPQWPENGIKIIAPVGMPAVKTFPVTKGAPPKGMSFPFADSAASATATQSEATEGGVAPSGDQDQPQEDGAEAEIDDGFTPEERRKNELEADPDFKKYAMMKRMKIPLCNIRKKIRDDGVKYTPADIDLFATTEEIEEANWMLI